jgi:hypothetical protein
MQIFGSPISQTAAADLPELSERFWFWRGASGRNYIHSIYTPDACPPLPGAVYVGVKRSGGLRIALTVGRFGPFWDHAQPASLSDTFAGCDEVHVHLLARGSSAADAVRADLVAAMLEQPYAGFAEDLPSKSTPSEHMRGENLQPFVTNAQLPQMQNGIGHILAA